MIKHLKNTMVMIVILLMTACAGQRSPEQIPVEDRSGQQERDVEIKLPETETGRATPSTDPYRITEPGMTENGAVTSLLDRALQQRSERQYAQAGATLERAIRIAPRNSEIYYQLAEIRLLQENNQQAQQLCLKAIVLAGDSLTMRRRCSELRLHPDSA